MASMTKLFIFGIILQSNLFAVCHKINGSFQKESQDIKGKKRYPLPIDERLSIIRPPIYESSKNYLLLRNHTNVLFKNFDLLKYRFENVSPGKNFKHDRYLSYQEQCNWISEVAFNVPRIATAFSIGYTYLKNEICALFVNVEKVDLPLMWLDGNMAARAWISSASLLAFTKRLLFSKDKWSQKLRSSFRFIIVPNLNPDGYEYSRTQQRMWIKNTRKVVKYSICFGVNLNRNFDAGTSGSENVCSDKYGAQPFSEMETQSVHKTFSSFTPIIVSFTFNAYGQMWMLPYACSPAKPMDYAEMERVAKIATMYIKKMNRTPYGVGKVSDLLWGTHAGATIDWSKLKMHSRYSYEVLLRPTTAGEDGFEIEAKWIKATSLDIFYGVYSVLINADLKPGMNGGMNNTDC